jgi:hypothetical protein
MGPAIGKQKSRRTAETRPSKMEAGRVKGEERIGSVIGVLTVEGTSGDPGLLFADKFVEVLKETDQDDEQRAGNSHKEDIGEHGHDGVGESDHTGIVNHAQARGQN